MTGCLGIGSSLKKDTKRASATAAAWLAMIDRNDFERSWEKTEELVKMNTSLQDWTTKMETHRDKFGKKQTRELETAEISTRITGAPEGKYAILNYRTTYEEQAMRERLILKLDESGLWKVASYNSFHLQGQ